MYSLALLKLPLEYVLNIQYGHYHSHIRICERLGVRVCEIVHGFTILPQNIQ